MLQNNAICEYLSNFSLAINRRLLLLVEKSFLYPSTISNPVLSSSCSGTGSGVRTLVSLLKCQTDIRLSPSESLAPAKIRFCTDNDSSWVKSARFGIRVKLIAWMPKPHAMKWDFMAIVALNLNFTFSVQHSLDFNLKFAVLCCTYVHDELNTTYSPH